MRRVDFFNCAFWFLLLLACLSHLVHRLVVAKAPQKVTTGLTGLDVQPEGRAILSKLYEKILSELQQMPADAPYRVHLTRVMNHRLDILRKTENVLEIEAKIEDGQVEEMIEEAEEELEVLALMAKEQPWKADKWHTIPVLWSDLKD